MPRAIFRALENWSGRLIDKHLQRTEDRYRRSLAQYHASISDKADIQISAAEEAVRRYKTLISERPDLR